MKKIFVFALLAAMVAVLMCGCQQPAADNGGPDYSEFAGTYRYTSTSVDSKSGTLVFKENGTYSYAGVMTDVPKEGDYEVDDDELVIVCPVMEEVEVEETFSVKSSGDKVTLTYQGEDAASAIFLMYFGYGAGKSLTFTKS